MTKKKKEVTQKPIPVVIAAIAGLVILECFALSKGINGTLFKLVVFVVGGLGGYLIKSPLKK